MKFGLKVIILLLLMVATTFASDPFFAPVQSTLAGATSKHLYWDYDGDSYGAIYSAGSITGNQGGDCGGGPATQQSLLTYNINLRLQILYGDGGSGLLPLSCGASDQTNQAQVSLGPGYQIVPDLGASQSGGATLYSIPNGSWVQVIGLHGTTVRIYYADESGTSQGFTVTIDGQSYGVLGATSSSANTARYVDVAVPANYHTVRLAPVGTRSVIWAVEGRNKTGISLRLNSFGSCRAECMGSNPAQQFAFLDLVPSSEVAMAVIAYTTNDWLANIQPTTTFKTWLTAIAQHYQSRGTTPLVFLDEVPSIGTQQYPKTDYSDVNGVVANAVGGYHLQIADSRFASSTVMSSENCYMDGTHMTAQCNDWESDDVLQTIVDATTFQPQPGVWYQLVSANSGKCLDMPISTPQQGASVWEWDCWGGAQQQWEITPVTGGYKITNQLSSLQLDVYGQSTASEAAVVVWPYWGGQNEIWQLTESRPGLFRISNNNSGDVLDVAGQQTGNGAQVWQYPWWGGSNQQWALIPYQY